MQKPKVSYAGKTLFFESLGIDSLTRREFLKKSTIIVAGATIFCITLNSIKPSEGEAVVTCCYSNCFSECHSNCGRKTW